jgi:hypothetical protein
MSLVVSSIAILISDSAHATRGWVLDQDRPCCTIYAGYSTDCGVGTTPCVMSFAIPAPSNPNIDYPVLITGAGWPVGSWTEVEVSPGCVGLAPQCLNGVCIWPGPPTDWYCGTYTMIGPATCTGGGGGGGGGVDD